MARKAESDRESGAESGSAPGSGGLSQVVARVAGNALKLLAIRFDQGIVELGMELHHAAAGLLWGALLIATASLSLGFFGVLIVLACLNTHPLLACAGVAIFFALLAVIAALRLRRAAGAQGSAIAGVRDEVKTDMTVLSGDSDDKRTG